MQERCRTEAGMDLVTSAKEMGTTPEEVLVPLTALVISRDAGGVDVCVNGVAENKEG